MTPVISSLPTRKGRERMGLYMFTIQLCSRCRENIYIVNKEVPTGVGLERARLRQSLRELPSRVAWFKGWEVEIVTGQVATLKPRRTTDWRQGGIVGRVQSQCTALSNRP